MKISDNGIKFIISVEGKENKAYHIKGKNGYEKYWTIGIGHYGPDVVPNSTISDAQVFSLFRKDIAKYESSVNRYIHVKLNQNQFDALVSFAHNEGEYALNPTTCTMSRLINAGKFTEASNQFKEWSGSQSGQSLYSRRMKEKALFLKAVTPVKKTVKTSDNEVELKKAQAKKTADALAMKKREDQARQQDLKEAQDDKKATAKAKLTKDATALKKAQATEKANALKRATAKKTADAKKAIIDKANKQREKNAYNSVNPIKNSISTPRDAKGKTSGEAKPKPNVLKSSIPLVGVLIMAIVLNNASIPETTLE